MRRVEFGHFDCSLPDVQILKFALLQETTLTTARPVAKWDFRDMATTRQLGFLGLDIGARPVVFLFHRGGLRRRGKQLRCYGRPRLG